MLSSIKLPDYLNGRHMSIGKPEVPNTPGWVDITPEQEARIASGLEKSQPECTNDEWIFHGTTEERAFSIITKGVFIPENRTGFEGCAGMYLACRGIAEYFAVHRAMGNGELYSSVATTPMVLAFKRKEIDEIFGHLLKHDSISDINPPSEVLWKHRVVDLHEDTELEGVERVKYFYSKSGLVYVSSPVPIDVSKLMIRIIA